MSNDFILIVRNDIQIDKLNKKSSLYVNSHFKKPNL